MGVFLPPSRRVIENNLSIVCKTLRPSQEKIIMDKVFKTENSDCTYAITVSPKSSVTSV